jgi:predicted RNA-binding Zn ribbon-like protein
MIRVDHVGVAARARLDAAGLLAGLFDLDREIADDGRFARLRVSPECTMVFYDSEQIPVRAHGVTFR